MKLLFSFILFLVLGCANLFAHHHNIDVKAMSSYEVAHQSQPYNDDALLIHQDFIFSTIHTTLEVGYRTIYTTDNEQVEEEESITAKKGTTLTRFPTSLDAEQFITLRNPLTKQFPPRNYFVYFPSNTIQILFCTFRI